MSKKPDNGSELTRSERINIRISVTQTVLALVGIFIGSVALYAALSESEAVRKQTEASVWPRLDILPIYYGLEGQERISIVTRNRGIGPAVIESVKVTVNSAPVKSWGETIRAIRPEEDFRISNWTIDGSVISPGEDITMLALEEQYSSADLTRAVRDAFRSGQAAIEICYCSVFGACWETRTNNSAPEVVKACESSEPTEF